MHLFKCSAQQSCELIVVEGKDAANAVNRVRNKTDQAVLAMQGKVPNVVKKKSQNSRLVRNPSVRLLLDVLESWGKRPGCGVLPYRYNKVIILSDPDADGWHAAMLLACLLAEVLPFLVSEKSLFVCRAPLFMVSTDGQEHCGYTHAELQSYFDDRRQPAQIHRYKGVASLSSELLYKTCVDPSTRMTWQLTDEDCEAIRTRLF